MAAALTLAVLVGAGCQERVVSTRNDWVGSQWGRLERDNLVEKDRRNDDEPGMFAQMGDAMFGWTDGLFGGDDEPQRHEFGYTGSRTPGSANEEDDRTVRRSDNAGLKLPSDGG